MLQTGFFAEVSGAPTYFDRNSPRWRLHLVGPKVCLRSSDGADSRPEHQFLPSGRSTPPALVLHPSPPSLYWQ